jgi:ornithine decarboxylase
MTIFLSENTKRLVDYGRILAEFEDTPFLLMSIKTVVDNYSMYKVNFTGFDIYYAIKANPKPEILDCLVKNGSCFDCASYNEIFMVSSAMLRVLGIIDFDRISFGNTMKLERDIKKAYDLGMRLFAVDSIDEVDALVWAANGSEIFCRIKTSGKGADWPLTKNLAAIVKWLINFWNMTHQNGLIARGVSFHVGSQQRDINAWDEPKWSTTVLGVLS